MRLTLHFGNHESKISVFLLIIFFISLLFQVLCAEKKSKSNGLIRHMKGEFVVKFKANVPEKNVNTKALNSVLNNYYIKEYRQIFKNAKNTKAAKLVNLYNVFLMYTDENSDILQIVRELNKEKYVEYAEPNYICEIEATEPNDLYYNLQSYLPQVFAPEAWDIQNGESSVIIGIIDTGVDWDHEDLAGIIWSNDDEMENGSDSDGNGYVDDIRGWDFVANSIEPHPGEDATTADNNPMDFNGHGTHVSGLAGAYTNNSTGVAAVSWGAKIMPLRAGWHEADGGGSVSSLYAAEAYFYATNNGAHITNQSSRNAGQTIVDAAYYAFLNGVLVFEGAGNDNVVDPTALGNQDFVITVASVNSFDQKAIYSSYGEYVDISAPGGDFSSGEFNGLLSTVVEPSDFFNSGYTYFDGTSMATPVAASVAALIKQAEPSLSVLDLFTRIQATADDIDALNPGYEGLLGAGRVNAYRALTELVYATPVFEFINVSIEDTVGNGDGDGFIEAGENFIIHVTIRNSWEGATGVAAQVSSESLWPIAINNGTANLGDLTGIMDKTNWQADASFYLTCSPEATTTIVEVPIVLSTNEGFEETLYIPVSVCPYDIQINVLEQGSGNPVDGYVKFYSVDEPLDSVFALVDITSGVVETQLPEGSYDMEIIANMPHEYKVINSVEITGSYNETIVLRKAQILLVDNDYKSNMSPDLNMETYYLDALLALEADYPFTYYDEYMKGFAPDQEILNGYDAVIWYTGSNNNPVLGTEYTNCLESYLENAGNLFMTGQGMLLFNMTNSFFSDYMKVRFKAIGPVNNSTLYVNSGNLISSDWMWMNFNGAHGADNQTLPDVLTLLDDGCEEIFFYHPPGDSLTTGMYYEDITYGYKAVYLGFGFEALTDLMDPTNGLQTRIQFMENVLDYFNVEPMGIDDDSKKNNIALNFLLKQNYPNPFNPETTIEYSTKSAGDVKLTIYNTLGQKIKSFFENNKMPGNYKLTWDGENSAGIRQASGIYYYKLECNGFTQTKKMVLIQ